MAQRYCTNCGAELREDDRFCPNCGRPVQETAAVSTPEADVPVPPPPQQEAGTQPLEQAEAQPRGPWTTGRLALGCLGVFFVVFVVGAGLAALGGNGGGGNEAEKNKKSGGGKGTAPKPELVVSAPSGSPTVTKLD
jgi:zinc-ribbon domain